MEKNAPYRSRNFHSYVNTSNQNLAILGVARCLLSYNWRARNSRRRSPEAAKQNSDVAATAYSLDYNWVGGEEIAVHFTHSAAKEQHHQAQPVIAMV